MVDLKQLLYSNDYFSVAYSIAPKVLCNDYFGSYLFLRDE